MFQRSSRPLRALLSLFDDVLGDPVDQAARHPHRRPLRWQPERRAGSVASRPEYCISPVQPRMQHHTREVAGGATADATGLRVTT
jgi:hypothetical protein